MKSRLWKILPVIVILGLAACTSQVSDTDRSEDADLILDPKPSDSITEDTQPSSELDSGEQAATKSEEDELALEDENVSSSDKVAEEPLEQEKDEFSEFDQLDDTAKESDGQVAQPEPLELPADNSDIGLDLGGEGETPPPIEEPAGPQVPTSKFNITGVQFKAHEGGGTIVISADQPMAFKTRMNAESNQFVVEIPKAQVNQKLKRPLVTKDFEGAISNIDLYQSKDQEGARVVVQLRANSKEPIVQTEGNSLLIVSGFSSENVAISEKGGINSLASLEDFLSGNIKFYGKKISIETSEAEVKDILRFIAEEAGVNMIINQDVSGKMTVKLREVPWDQALIVILKSKSLGYTRAGSVLRIGTLKSVQDEESSFITLAESRKRVEPLQVKLIPISYAKPDEIAKQTEKFVTERGKIVGDVRTSSLIVTDTADGIDRVERFVKSIDIPPLQVLIEGKIVEAQENFERQIGINWVSSGALQKLTDVQSSNGPIRSLIGFTTSPGVVSGETFSANWSLGTLDILGDIQAFFQLREREGQVKILSSPRILTLHNEPSEISQRSRLPIITSTVTPGGIPVPSVSYVDVNLLLRVTPQVTNDASVILAVEVNRDVPGEIVELQTQSRPISQRAAKTKVLVKNGQTAVIGGIYQSDSQESDSRVPVLGRIPVIGWLFRTKSRSETKSELLIFLTPRIINRNELWDKGNTAGG